jgi:hypothetical protein
VFPDAGRPRGADLHAGILARCQADGSRFTPPVLAYRLWLAVRISAMLFSFGPGVFLLYVERWKRLHPMRSNDVTGGT